MLDIVIALIDTLASALGSRKDLALEHLALRQQLAVAKRHMKRSELKDCDRIFWIVLARCWARWRDVLFVVKPDTVVRWHRLGFRYYWRKKSTPTPGRPPIPRELGDLIRRMSAANPLWGAPKIHGELLKLGIEISQATVSRYMPRQKTKPSQSWKTFLDNHVRDLASINLYMAAAQHSARRLGVLPPRPAAVSVRGPWAPTGGIRVTVEP
jgi:putative transposase